VMVGAIMLLLFAVAAWVFLPNIRRHD